MSRAAHLSGGDFQEWVRQYQALALRVAWEFLFREHDVQEVVQEALMACWERREVLSDEDAFRRLLLGAVVNQCRKRRRSYARKPLEPSAPPEEAAPDEAALKAERIAALKRALDELEDDERAAVLLCLAEGLSYDDAAGALETSVPALRNRLYRARKTLRERLEDFLG